MSRTLDPAVIRHQIENLLVQYPELEEDAVLRSDMIEGETEAFTFLSALVRVIGDSTALAVGTADYIKQLSERKARIDRRIDALRELAMGVMETAHLHRAELPEATLSIRNNPPKPIITDKDLIPDILCRIKREPDMAKIKADLEANGPNRFAMLSNGGQSLAIRIK